MKPKRIALLSLLVVLSAAVAFGQLRGPMSGIGMTTTGQAFVKSLNDDQRSKAVLGFENPVRTDWHYIPKPTRKGLQVREMNEGQRAAALALLRSALSAVGYGKATRIMQLEAILRELEKAKTGSPLRDPERYYFTLFGQPQKDARWGLSIEGHHLSLNFVVEGDRVISSTPTFFGANPGMLMADYGGDFKKGDRVLAKEEELAFELLGSLSEEQRKKAIVAAKAPSDVRDAGKTAPPSSPAVGIAASELNTDQMQKLKSLVEVYARNLPDDVAAERLAGIEKAGWSEVKFAWAGADKPGVGHDYRIQGATFLIEFNNTQPDSAGNVANHIHSVWHDLAGNFAIPVAAAKAASASK